jgi:hypothetical protein
MKEILTVQDWLDCGYRRFDFKTESLRSVNKNADFMLQKCISDERGKKYFISIYCYDRNNYPEHVREQVGPVGFMAEVQFKGLEYDKPFFNISMNGLSLTRSFRTVEEIEQYFELFWNTLNQPYYELREF